jgi:hypothetical protein
MISRGVQCPKCRGNGLDSPITFYYRESTLCGRGQHIIEYGECIRDHEIHRTSCMKCKLDDMVTVFGTILLSRNLTPHFFSSRSRLERISDNARLNSWFSNHVKDARITWLLCSMRIYGINRDVAKLIALKLGDPPFPPIPLRFDGERIERYWVISFIVTVLYALYEKFFFNWRDDDGLVTIIRIVWSISFVILVCVSVWRSRQVDRLKSKLIFGN